MPLGLRLAVLVAAPLLVIAVAAGDRLLTLEDQRATGEVFAQRIDEAAAIDTAIVYLQAERELTARLLVAPPEPQPFALRDALRKARRDSDEAIATAGLSTLVPPFDLETFVRPWQAEARLSLDTIEDLRTLVDRRVLPPPDAILIYSAVMYGYLGALNEAISVDEGVVPPSELIAYTAALASAESFIQARAWGTVLISSPAPGATTREWILLSSLAQTEDFFLGQARRTSAGDRHAVDRLLDAPSSRDADNLRWAVIASGANGGSVTAEVWQEGTQPRVDAWNQTTAFMLADLTEGAEASVAAANRAFATIATAAVLLVVLGAFAAWRVTRSIARPLGRLAVGARDASVGRFSEVDLPQSRDAIGEIGTAYGALNQYLHHIADAAEEIAGGDLTREIAPRSSEDRLGTALQTMTRQLSSMVVRSRRRSEALEETVGALQETAARDPLTGLLNRGRFVELVDVAIDGARATNSRFGMLFIDLDGFKQVNDELGHAAGDELLRQVASRLLGALRVDDVVARLGGDEFTVLVTNGFDAVAIESLARQVVDLVGAPYFVHGETVEVRASIGLARFPEHGATVATLLVASDQAMYAAKRVGGNGMSIAVHQAPAA
ncbi:MAG: diguanylate cyclase [Chloroflexi bacterium]|nr:diguanylate cyclase [Chloroflexota bacterium]MDA1147517.1 diguanylate cyclase [Chloroflexota bacterium]